MLQLESLKALSCQYLENSVIGHLERKVMSSEKLKYEFVHPHSAQFLK